MTRVAIVDDHGLFRAGVRAELEGHVELVGEAASVADAVALVVAQHPDVVLLDVHMPDGGGVAVIRGSADEAPDTLFLALSASDAAEDVIATIRAGARGYVTKNIATDELLDAIARVQAGDGELQVYVRDRGPGFDPAALPEDRRGVRESIVGRMARHGGRAAIHSAPGAGTEVELTIPGAP